MTSPAAASPPAGCDSVIRLAVRRDTGPRECSERSRRAVVISPGRPIYMRTLVARIRRVHAVNAVTPRVPAAPRHVFVIVTLRIENRENTTTSLGPRQSALLVVGRRFLETPKRLALPSSSIFSGGSGIPPGRQRTAAMVFEVPALLLNRANPSAAVELADFGDDASRSSEVGLLALPR